MVRIVEGRVGAVSAACGLSSLCLAAAVYVRMRVRCSLRGEAVWMVIVVFCNYFWGKVIVRW